MNTGEAISQGISSLQGIYPPGEATAMMQLVIEELTGLAPSAIALNKRLLLSAEQQRQLSAIMGRLQTHEPVQYVINQCWFYGLKLYVNNAVLIPRPETEELVHWVVTDLQRSLPQTTNATDTTTTHKILDVGTGSGCIALALKKALPQTEVWGCDSSEEALNIARRNGAALDIRVDFQGVDFLSEAQQKSLPQVSTIISNPPYIAAAQMAEMAPNVTAWEPHTALFVPDADPLLFYRALARFAHTHLLPGGALYVEVHEAKGPDVAALFKEEGLRNVVLHHDMQGKDRMVKAEQPGDD